MSLELRFYRPTRLQLGSVELEVLELVRREPLKLEAVNPGDAVEKVYDILVNVVERYRNDPETYVVEVTARLKTGEIAAATLTKKHSTTSASTVMLYPRPVRLKRIGVMDKTGKTKWYEIEKEVYVFHGRFIASADVELIILDTEEGLRTITVREVEDLKLEQAEAKKQEQTTRKRRRKRKT